MRIDKATFVVVATIVAFVVAGCSTALGQEGSCPASPNYSPDFSSNQGCLTLNGTPAGSGYPGFFAPASTLVPPTGTTNPAGPAPAGVNTVLRLTPNSTFTSSSAWFNTPQPVGASFSTTFTFQLSNTTTPLPADGIAFVIQNSAAGTGALDADNNGTDGCSLGFGDAPDGTCTGHNGGIPNSIAIEFDTYQNPDIGDPSANHVAIQSCGTGANSVENGACRLADNSNLPITLADGQVHTAIVSYVLQARASQTACIANNVPGPCLDVILDGTDLFPAGVSVNLSTLLSLTSGNAYVGFTGATGGATDIQDIQSWTFTPQAQTQTLQPGTPATFPFQNNAYSYQATLNNESTPTTTTVTPILMTPDACDALVQTKYPGAHCFVYTGLAPDPDSAVMFEVTCPNLPNSQCTPFSADLGTTFTLSTQSGVNMYNPLDPFPGWLKGFGGVNNHPCTPPNSGPLFQSDQISGFIIDPKTHGSSGGTGSCWVATYSQPDEVPPGITITSPANTFYAQNAMVVANYTCSNPTTSQPSSSAVGPYLTVASCTQSTGTQTGCTQTPNGMSCTGSVNTSQLGTFPFQVTATDTGLNTSTQSVNYTVVAPTNLQILKLAPPGPVATGGTINYLIGVADFGPVNADGVIVTDPLPSNTTFVSGSGSNVACGIVNKKLSCSVTPVACSASGNTVTCNVGMLTPLSVFPLNGAAMTIKVQVTAKPTTMCGKQPCTINTATVSAANTDTNANPTSTAKTIW